MLGNGVGIVLASSIASLRMMQSTCPTVRTFCEESTSCSSNVLPALTEPPRKSSRPRVLQSSRADHPFVMSDHTVCSA